MTVTDSIANPLLLDVSTLRLTDEQFYQLCISNPDAQLELTAQGVPVAMSPVGGDSGKREANLITDLNIWNRQTGSAVQTTATVRLTGCWAAACAAAR